MKLEKVTKSLPNKVGKGPMKSDLRISIEALVKGECLEVRFTELELAETPIQKLALRASVMVGYVSRTCKNNPKRSFSVRMAENGYDVFRIA